MAFLLWHTVGSAKTHNDKEGSHVLPGRFRPMADDDYAASVPSEQAASDRLGPLELRHGAGPLVRPDGGESYAGQGDEAQRADGPPATAGMVLRHPRKRGPKRQALHVETCFAPLLGWVVSWWQGTQLALAIDATTLGERFVVLAVSVVYRGCAIPVAWVILPAGTKHAWRREGLRLLRRLHRAIPRAWTVIVLADRGLYAPWLFRRITRLGWHPFLRVNTAGRFRAAGATGL